MNKTQSFMARTALAGAFAFAGQATAANVIVNSSFNNDSGTAITGTGGSRTISGWGTMHLYNHTYNGTQGPKLGAVGSAMPTYGVNDDIVISEASGLNGTYKGLNNGTSNPTQVVNLTTSLSSFVINSIDAGTAQFSFSSWMAGYFGDAVGVDVVSTRLRFFTTTNGTGTALATFSLDRGLSTNRVTTADILLNPGGANNATSQTDTDWWALYELQTTVPVGARSLIVDFVASSTQTANGGGSRDWYADHVVVDIVPEPSTAILGGLGLLGLLRRRR